jgi:5-methylcytosine-specific restriction endonuclease McrA
VSRLSVKGRPWRRLCAIVYATHTRIVDGQPVATCIICGQPIDMLLPHPHKKSKSVDHRLPLALGGHPTDLANLGPAHLDCNLRKGDRVDVEPVRSREW